MAHKFKNHCCRTIALLPLVFKLKGASESPEVNVKTQIVGPHFRVSDALGLEVQPDNLHLQKSWVKVMLMLLILPYSVVLKLHFSSADF